MELKQNKTGKSTPPKEGLIEKFEKECIKHLLITVMVGGLVVFVIVPMILPTAWTHISPSFTESDMTGRWISVFMALIFTVFVTQGLLKRQSENQKEERKNELELQFKHKIEEKVYEEKLKMYKEYLDELGKIIEDGELNKKEEIRVRIMTASIAIHTDNKALRNLCAEVVNVVKSQCDPFDSEEDWKRFIKSQDGLVFEEGSEKRQIRSDIMLTSLMKIASYFHRELYKGEEGQGERINFQEERDMFSRLYNIANPDVEESGSQNVPRSTISSIVNENIFPNWKLILHEKSEWKMLSLEPRGDIKFGEIYIRPWGNRCAMVMRYLNESGEAVKDFADEVKYWFYRSNLRTVYGEWRNTLDDDQWCKKYDAQKLLSNGTYSFAQEITSDEFLTRYREDSFFRSHLEDMLKNFVKYMEQYQRRCRWKKNLEEFLSKEESVNNNLQIYPHITTLWCEYSTPTKDGFVRLSLNEETQKDGKMLAHVLISRYNADAAFERLLDTLPGTKLNTRPKSELMQEINDKGHVRVASFDYIMCEDDKTINEEQTADKAKAIFEEWNTLLKTVQ